MLREFLNHPGHRRRARPRRPPSEGSNMNWRPTQCFGQNVVYPLVDPKPSCATTAANGRDGWIADLREPMANA
jgi:hypothetical protein